MNTKPTASFVFKITFESKYVKQNRPNIVLMRTYKLV